VNNVSCAVVLVQFACVCVCCGGLRWTVQQCVTCRCPVPC
jgi:hypothetical protein